MKVENGGDYFPVQGSRNSIIYVVIQLLNNDNNYYNKGVKISVHRDEAESNSTCSVIVLLKEQFSETQYD